VRLPRRIASWPSVALRVIAVALLLSACGSDTENGGPSPSAIADAPRPACASGTLTAAGSTAQGNAVAQWASDYRSYCPGANISYDRVGSGQGILQFQNGGVDFAGSDFPLNSGDEQRKANARCESGSAINIPMVPGPIAIGYNVPNVLHLNLSASTLSKIFDGKITSWNDPVIAQDNPGEGLPSLAIQTFHRSDDSGTSYNFTNYLANEAPADWSFGAQKSWRAPGGHGVKGSEEIAKGVASTWGGIGYIELSYATQISLPYASVGNAGGNFVQLTNDNVRNFLSKAKVVGLGNDLKLQFDYSDTDPHSYPNLLITYEIVCASGNDPAKLQLLKNFLSYVASDAGQRPLPAQGYFDMPRNLQVRVLRTISSLR